MEALENREMLSSVQIFAAGDLGGEEFALQIDGQTVEQFTVTQDLTTFEFQADSPVTADQISIEFLNDQFAPANGIDSNLIVDAIAIDGVRFETEAASVFSTGNSGAIVGTGNQRNGTVYVDGTGDNFDIVNLAGLIDAGEGNDGSGIAIETGDVNGDQVSGSVFNSGIVQGRGTGAGNQTGHGLRFVGGAGTDGTAVFTGDVVNTGVISGSADSDLAAGISIEDTGVSGTIVNSGLISGASVAIDASSSNSSLDLVNDGTINGDVLFGSQNDALTFNQNGAISGAIDGGAGFDTLNVNFGNFDAGVAFVASLDLSNIEAINIDGQQFFA